MSDFDVRPIITALARLVRAGLSPTPLKLVAEDVPNMQSTQAPVMFFDYVSGNNGRNAYGGFERVFFVDCVGLMGLAQDVKDTDIAIKSFIGPFYDLISADPTLGGVVFDAYIISDQTSAPVMLAGQSGGIRYGAITFRLQITMMPTTGGAC